MLDAYKHPATSFVCVYLLFSDEFLYRFQYVFNIYCVNKYLCGTFYVLTHRSKHISFIHVFVPTRLNAVVTLIDKHEVLHDSRTLYSFT